MKNKKPGAWIVAPSDRGRKKIYKDKTTNERRIYLEDKEYFEIELYNPTSDNLLADIYLDGKPISGSGLILKRGKRIYLDCFIEDRKKFVFSTYDVENTNETLDAISENGILTVRFYKEKVDTSIQLGNSLNNNNNILAIGYYGCGSTHYPHGTITTNNYFCTDSNNISYSSNSLKIETGQTEKGEQSNMEFNTVNMDFTTYVDTIVEYKLLPLSRKPIMAKTSKSSNTNINNGTKNIDDIYESIIKLNELLDKGLLSKEEFEMLKAKVIL